MRAKGVSRISACDRDICIRDFFECCGIYANVSFLQGVGMVGVVDALIPLLFCNWRFGLYKIARRTKRDQL